MSVSPLADFPVLDVAEEEDGKQEPRGEPASIMSSLFLRSSLGSLVTVFGAFSASRNKFVTQAAAVPHLYYLRKTMHYHTEERGQPNSTDYRIYFSKFIIGIMKETIIPTPLQQLNTRSVSDREPQVDLHVGKGKVFASAFFLCSFKVKETANVGPRFALW